jgi:hypothetical protein
MKKQAAEGLAGLVAGDALREIDGQPHNVTCKITGKCWSDAVCMVPALRVLGSRLSVPLCVDPKTLGNFGKLYIFLIHPCFEILLSY